MRVIVSAPHVPQGDDGDAVACADLLALVLIVDGQNGVLAGLGFRNDAVQLPVDDQRAAVHRQHAFENGEELLARYRARPWRP